MSPPASARAFSPASVGNVAVGFDILGHSLAGPGETIVTSQVRDDLTDGLDGELRDMGECYLKHVPEPVRVWRVGDASAQPLLTPASEQPGTLLPGIAVIPFAARSNTPEHFAVGELVADAVISLLGRSPHLRVISRLSCSAFRQRDAALGEVSQRLGAQFVLSGSYVVFGSAGGGKLLITAELCDARSGRLVWTERFNAEVGDLLQAVEAYYGRVRDVRWGDRTLDIDLILFGGRVIRDERLTVPHPRAHERDFVLAPWLEHEPGFEQRGIDGPVTPRPEAH